ncbi:MAG: hypothetical protein AAF616_04330 [Bacteroidota bacterium]
MKTTFLAFSLLLFSGRVGYTQAVAFQQNEVLARIVDLQIEEDLFYDSGLFHTQRHYGKRSYRDNSLFYPTLVALTLRALKDKVPSDQSPIIDQIVTRVRQNAFTYQSRRGRPAFNFWQTNPDIPHPDGPEKYQKEKYKVPDDFDDTSMIGILLDSPQFSWQVREEMVRYTNSRKKKVKTTFKRFKKSEAYGVWFADKWKQEFDISVMANTLYFVFKSGYSLNKYDSASIDFIKQSIREDLHRKQPFVLSPYYTRTPIILYHLARMIEEDKEGVFRDIKLQIVSDIRAELEADLPEIYKAALASALIKLGESCDYSADESKLRAEIQDFRWFSANLMLAIGTGTALRKILNDSKLIPTFFWHCEAYYWTLIYEYLTLMELQKQKVG